MSVLEALDMRRCGGFYRIDRMAGDGKRRRNIGSLKQCELDHGHQGECGPR